MAGIFKEISIYQVLGHSGPDGDGLAEASILLTLPDAFGYMDFYRDGITLPPNKEEVHPTGVPFYRTRYRLAQFGNVVDILRNEKPVFLFFEDETLQAYITTGAEPTGEAEK